jgi:predicted outer membrane protein
MSSEESFRRLGLGLIMLEEKLEELKTYAQEMVRDSSKFDANVLTNISDRLVTATYELNQSYENYKSTRSE